MHGLGFFDFDVRDLRAVGKFPCRGKIFAHRNYLD